jgi:hypothetical protein
VAFAVLVSDATRRAHPTKGAEFLWTNECREALQCLKDIVTSEPVLVPPQQNKQFILEVDASQYATRAILYQADPKLKDRKGNPLLRPCRYHAQIFSTTEQQYPIYDREFLAIMRGLTHWDYLLQAPRPAPTIVITDHTNLQYYRHPHKIGPRVAGYISTIEEYPIALMYKPGKTNRADALSRRPDFAPDPYNDEPAVALPEELFV